MMNRCVNQRSATGVGRKETTEINVAVPVLTPPMGEEIIQPKDGRDNSYSQVATAGYIS